MRWQFLATCRAPPPSPVWRALSGLLIAISSIAAMDYTIHGILRASAIQQIADLRSHQRLDDIAARWISSTELHCGMNNTRTTGKDADTFRRCEGQGSTIASVLKIVGHTAATEKTKKLGKHHGEVRAQPWPRTGRNRQKIYSERDCSSCWLQMIFKKTNVTFNKAQNLKTQKSLGFCLSPLSGVLGETHNAHSYIPMSH